MEAKPDWLMFAHVLHGHLQPDAIIHKHTHDRTKHPLKIELTNGFIGATTTMYVFVVWKKGVCWAAAYKNRKEIRG